MGDTKFIMLNDEDGDVVYVNPASIAYLQIFEDPDDESTAETMVCFTSGEKLYVEEDIDDVMDAIKEVT